MSQTTPPTVDALPTAPNSSTPVGFSLTMDNFLAALIVLRTQLVALGANIYANCVDAYNSAVAAATSASTASSAAAAATATAGATLWVSGATVAQYANVISPATAYTYRRKTATGSGSTDPASDTTNYVLVSNFGYVQTADQTITSGGALTIAHGLGRTPIFMSAFLKNVTAASGYSTGDIVPTPIGAVGNGASLTGVVVTADATNIYVRFSSYTDAFTVLHKTTGAGGDGTNSKWSFFARVLA